MADQTDRDEAGRFLPGNKFWMARSSAGIKPKFENPEALEAACMEYFDWVHENPIMIVELVKHQGKANQVQVPKMRAMTIVVLTEASNDQKIEAARKSLDEFKYRLENAER